MNRREGTNECPFCADITSGRVSPDTKVWLHRQMIYTNEPVDDMATTPPQLLRIAGMVNNILPWIDGWVYACHGFSNTSEFQGTDGQKIVMQSGNTFRFRADGSHVEYFTHGQVNPFGLAFDPLGNLYSADCHTLPVYQLLVEPGIRASANRTMGWDSARR